MSKIKAFLPALLVLLGFAAYFLFRPHEYYGNIQEPPGPALNFTLTSANGPVSLSDYRGKLVLLYFGYTFCPDVCPTTLANVAKALTLLGDGARDVQLIMISVDPERDTPQKLSGYVSAFSPGFIGVTGTKTQIDQVTGQYGVFYQKHTDVPENYAIDHTASLLVIDRENRVALIIPYGNTPAQIADDLRHLLN